MMEGAVGCRVLFAGRLSLRSLCGEATAAMMMECRKMQAKTAGARTSTARDGEM